MYKINVDLNKTYVTNGVNAVLENDLFKQLKMTLILDDFVKCIFDESMDKEDVKLNMKAVELQDGRVLAPYDLDGVTIWIIHYFGENGYTTILLPSEY